MQVTVKLVGPLQNGRFKERICVYPDGTSIQAIVDGFGFRDHLLGIILVNGVHAGFEDLLQEGDTLSLLPVFDGG